MVDPQWSVLAVAAGSYVLYHSVHGRLPWLLQSYHRRGPVGQCVDRAGLCIMGCGLIVWGVGTIIERLQ